MMEYRNYEEIKLSLDKKIRVVERKTQTLDKLRDSKQPPNQEEYKILHQEVMPLEKEEIALVLDYKSKSYLKHGKHYSPIIISTNQDIDKLINQIKKQTRERKSFNYNLIMNSDEEGHYTPIHIDFSNDKLSFYTVDAADDALGFKFSKLFYELDSMESIDKNMRGHLGAIQKDGISCAVFSIQNLDTMQKLENTLEQYLPKMFEDSDISKLHPRFVKNAQSFNTINTNSRNTAHYTINVTKDRTLQQHTDEFTIIDREEYNPNSIKPRNYAITYKTLKYLKIAKAELEAAYVKGGEELLQKTIRHRTIDGLIEHEKKHDITANDSSSLSPALRQMKLPANHDTSSHTQRLRSETKFTKSLFRN